ncbi:hypothetical protein [Polyangium sp. 6x1]|uniref:hypothetical protein n=1 Tax=Polyangium sp. 6x1 TaxID=3042689 RepID=UPI0024831B5A|nr:hypothetical protein [Polyangium sp. 6x1]
MKNLTRALALTFTLALTALIGVGCSCDEDEFNAKDTCQKLVDAVNGVRAGCNEAPVGALEVCETEIGSCSEGAYCSAKVDVDACVKRIQEFSCMSSAFSPRTVPECQDVLGNILGSCGPETGGGDDDDD